MSPARTPGSVGRRIFLIATEEFGDRLGAGLMKVLRQRLGDAVEFEGVGGRAMAREGLSSLFPIEELSIIGFAGVVMQLPKILRLIRQTADAVIAAEPDILVIIDSPDFTHRVARRVRARDAAIPIVDYVSPTVWAWRPGRARAMLRYVDHVLALLPFEPEEYRRLRGPPCSYVGHPLTEQLASLRPECRGAEAARRRTAGSAGAAGQPAQRDPASSGGVRPGAGAAPRRGRSLRADAADHAASRERRCVKGSRSWEVPPQIVIGENEKRAAFRIARAALAKSGTVTLELALAGVPMVTAYRVGGDRRPLSCGVRSGCRR